VEERLDPDAVAAPKAQNSARHTTRPSRGARRADGRARRRLIDLADPPDC
jgi:hypothetical protein